MPTEKNTREQLQMLCEKFARTKGFRRDGMVEHAVRRQYVEPFFEALGWDVRDDEQVTAEERDNEGKRPDYVFRCRRDVPPAFVVEIKAPSVDLDGDTRGPMFQRGRDQVLGYAMRAGAPCAVLTNFVDLHIFLLRDGAETTHALACRYQMYAQEPTFSAIRRALGREAVIASAGRPQKDTRFEFPAIPSPGAFAPTTHDDSRMLAPAPFIAQDAASRSGPPPALRSAQRGVDLRRRRVVGAAVIAAGLAIGGVAALRSSAPSPEESVGCRVVASGTFHLRPRITARSVGPEYPGGTRVLLTAAHPGVTRGDSSMFGVQLATGEVGFMFVSPAELSARTDCPAR